jgi:hypothetical protein
MLEIIKVGIHRGKLGTYYYWMGISMGGFSLFLALVPVQTMPIKELLFIPVTNPAILQ